MLNGSTLRYRYTQFFLLFVFCSLAYVMVQSIGPGINQFQENFYKKTFLIEKANWFRMKLGDRILPVSLIGNDGWVDYTGDGNIDDFQHLKQFTNKKALVKKLNALNQYLKPQGITLLIVVPPNKATIYPDKLPEQIKPLSTRSRLDQFITLLKAHHLPIFVDLRPSLQSARQNQDVYFKENNTHWNGYGAFVAYTAIINILGSSHPELRAYKAAELELISAAPGAAEPDFYFAPKNPFVHTLHLSLNKDPHKILGTDYGYNQFSSIPDSTLPTLLMFHDSFGAYYLNDYLSMNFGKSHFVHLRDTPQYLNQEAIQQLKPDVVIIEIVERDLDLLTNILINFGPK
jgi:hypothetical protein